MDSTISMYVVVMFYEGEPVLVPREDIYVSRKIAEARAAQYAKDAAPGETFEVWELIPITPQQEAR